MDYKHISANLIGNATQNAEIKQAKESGTRYGDFHLAVSGRKEGDETSFFPVRCFGKLADGLAGIQKGTKVFVTGDLEISSYEADDGTKRMGYRVIADTYRILSNERHRGNDSSEVAE